MEDLIKSFNEAMIQDLFRMLKEQVMPEFVERMSTSDNPIIKAINKFDIARGINPKHEWKIRFYFLQTVVYNRNQVPESEELGDWGLYVKLDGFYQIFREDLEKIIMSTELEHLDIMFLQNLEVTEKPCLTVNLKSFHYGVKDKKLYGPH